MGPTFRDLHELPVNNVECFATKHKHFTRRTEYVLTIGLPSEFPISRWGECDEKRLKVLFILPHHESPAER